MGRSDHGQQPNESTRASSANPERWVDEHGDCLNRYALVRVRVPKVAEDLVQETLVAAVRSREKFGGRSSERSWLVGRVVDASVFPSRGAVIPALTVIANALRVGDRLLGRVN